MEQENILVEPTVVCYHCGEKCDQLTIREAEKHFCCAGCKTVYQILSENDLCNYYELNQAAGISFKRRSNEKYGYLDDEGIEDRLIDFRDGNRTVVHFFLPQIHCSSCLWLLENLSRLDSSILSSKVNFLKKEVHIQYATGVISLRQVVELLSSLGYAPVLLLDKLDEDKVPTVDRSLYYKLGLAGFAFGNIMLLSFPEYLGLDPAVDGAFVRFFGYLNIVLILPVVSYSAQDYLRSAWHGLQQRHLNIDVPISLGILALMGRSFYEILSHTGAGYLDSLAGLIFFLLVGKWFQQKTFHKISFDRDYKSYFPMATHLLIHGKEKPVTIDKLKQGDRIVIREGELVPADTILLAGDANIDYSFVTGEAVLTRQVSGDKVFAGGRQMGGILQLEVLRPVDQSYLTSLWNDSAFSKSASAGTASDLADRVAKYFTAIILLIALCTLLYWLPQNASVAINAVTAVLIIACPCAVALSIPFTFGNVLRILGDHGFYL
ncbi:MAG: ATPase P, partial [Saprospiraceae bacterium]|nr:ATPase P [Saprospiraceae bacterium]